MKGSVRTVAAAAAALVFVAGSIAPRAAAAQQAREQFLPL